MGTILGTAIIGKVEVQLLDDAAQPGGGHIRFNTVANPTELAKWLYTAVRELIKEKPDASTHAVDFTPAAGVRQTLPAGELLLVDVRALEGPNVTPVTLSDMDGSVRGWRTHEAGPAVHFMHDERDPSRFYLYPPQDGDTDVELITSFDPGYANAAAAIPIDDIWEQALIDFVHARALEKSTKREAVAKSVKLDNSFYARIGSKTKTQFTYSGGVRNDGSAQ